MIIGIHFQYVITCPFKVWWWFPKRSLSSWAVHPFPPNLTIAAPKAPSPAKAIEPEVWWELGIQDHGHKENQKRNLGIVSTREDRSIRVLGNPGKSSLFQPRQSLSQIWPWRDWGGKWRSWMWSKGLWSMGSARDIFSWNSCILRWYLRKILSIRVLTLCALISA